MRPSCAYRERFLYDDCRCLGLSLASNLAAPGGAVPRGINGRSSQADPPSVTNGSARAELVTVAATVRPRRTALLFVHIFLIRRCSRRRHFACARSPHSCPPVDAAERRASTERYE